MIKRFILNQLQKELTQPEILILLGPRQVGKTTLLKALKDHALKQGAKTAFFDLEQPYVLLKFNQSDQEIVKLIQASGDVVFIDEFQYVGNISKIFKALFDAEHKVKVVCSGSSALEIHKHLKESLAGRRFLYQIFPLQFSEMKHSDPHCSFPDHLIYGGMPGLTHATSDERKQQILNELLGSYLLKDIKSLVKEENIRAFNHLLYLLAENQGSLISIHSLSKEIGLSPKAIDHYMEILEQTYTNYRIYSYSKNLGNELKKSCKAYIYDLGIRNALLKDFSSLEQRIDKGIILETFVFLKLKSILRPNMEIKFWRTKDGAEVDFILLKDRKPIPIEVKSQLKNLDIPSGLNRFLTRYPKTGAAYVINQNLNGKRMLGSCQVNFMTFEEFSNSFSAGIKL